MRAKISVENVDNGYIVRVIKQGESVLKELYENPIMVFHTERALYSYLQGFYKRKGKVSIKATASRAVGEKK